MNQFKTPLQNAEKPLQNAPIPADGQGDAPALLALLGPFSSLPLRKEK